MKRIRFFSGKPGESYLPSNGTEGDLFRNAWCARCDRDKVENGSATVEEADRDHSLYCDILNTSYYAEPPEWIYDINGQPQCVDFVPMVRKT